MNIKKWIASLFFLTTFVAVSASWSNEALYTSTDEIQKVVKQYVSESIEHDPDEEIRVSVPHETIPDRMPFCNTSLDPGPAPDGEKKNLHAVILSCEQPVNPWQTLIPVKVHVVTQVAVANHNIPAGKSITVDDIVMEGRDSAAMYNGYFREKDSIKGLVTSKVILAGSPLTMVNTQKPILIHKNDEVVLEIVKGSISVSMKGIAKSSGRLDETVQILNPRSKKSVEAQVSGEKRAVIQI